MQAITSTLTLNRDTHNAVSRPAAPAVVSPRRVDSRLLLRESKELVIEHMGQEYRLRRTRNDKLILTK
ncbi:MAG TPA: hemin uptake protein HemP [Tahibacter sp.]|jgi:hemin uptake protein HemP|nr:hemin uptake protein HemP [Tahibacter sp.]